MKLAVPSWAQRLAVVAGALAVVAVVTSVVVLTTDNPSPRVAPTIVDAFGADATIDTTGNVRAAFSPSGRQLLVIDDDGIAIAAAGERRPVTRSGSNVVDAAWFPAETAVLVAEGPIPTGELPVVELDGRVRGSVVLQPSFGVGIGYGSDVHPAGRMAAITAEVREVIGGRRRTHLVLVDLTTGSTDALTPADGPDERGPFFLDEQHIAYTAVGEDRMPGAAIIDLTTRTTTIVSPSAEPARVVGTVAGEPAYASGATVWVGSASNDRRRLVRVDAGDPVAVHPEGRAVVTRTASALTLVTVHQ